MHLPPNTQLQGGKYRIIRFISSGGFGCTYEAELVLLHKRVAIKEFFVRDFCNRDSRSLRVTVGTHSQSLLIDRLKTKFLEEAAALYDMHDAHIVRVTDVFEENGTAYYVMDYIDGMSLFEKVKKQGKLPEHEAVDYIKQVAGALKSVHSQGRLHLDIKPGNIMVDSKGQAILIDFGASKQYDEVDGENTSTLMGKTPGYAPVEQMSNRVQTFSPATDIYSLGATMYKLLTGVTSPDAADLASGDTRLTPLPSTISSSVRNAVMKAMSLRRIDRQQNVDQFIAQMTYTPPVTPVVTSSRTNVASSNEETIRAVDRMVTRSGSGQSTTRGTSLKQRPSTENKPAEKSLWQKAKEWWGEYNPLELWRKLEAFNDKIEDWKDRIVDWTDSQNIVVQVLVLTLMPILSGLLIAAVAILLFLLFMFLVSLFSGS